MAASTRMKRQLNQSVLHMAQITTWLRALRGRWSAASGRRRCCSRPASDLPRQPLGRAQLPDEVQPRAEFPMPAPDIIDIAPDNPGYADLGG